MTTSVCTSMTTQRQSETMSNDSMVYKYNALTGQWSLVPRTPPLLGMDSAEGAPRIPDERTPRYHAGSPRSVRQLNKLGFDPIFELVSKYREIDEEIQIMKEVQSGERVHLTPSGRPRRYDARAHAELL